MDEKILVTRSSMPSLEEYIEAVRNAGHGDLEMFHTVKQPAYINNNVYLNGADVFEKENNYFKGEGAGAKLVHKEKEVYLQITIPEGAFAGLDTELIGTHNLELTRLSEEAFENPDGSPIVIDKDLLQNPIGAHPVPGPLQSLKEGENLIRIW